MIMASMKKKQKEYDSLWDEEGGEYDPEGVLIPIGYHYTKQKEHARVPF